MLCYFGLCVVGYVFLAFVFVNFGFAVLYGCSGVLLFLGFLRYRGFAGFYVCCVGCVLIVVFGWCIRCSSGYGLLVLACGVGLWVLVFFVVLLIYVLVF